MNYHKQPASEKAIALTQALLSNTYFEGFKFDTSFTLRFGRNSKKYFQGHELPIVVELYLLSDWWLYSREDWEKRITYFPTAETKDWEEPVQAYELANLRWIGKSTINSVILNEEVLFISFEYGRTITVSCAPVDGESWILNEHQVEESNQKWSVVCENNELFVRTPQL